MDKRGPLVVVILTRDEEVNIAKAILSVQRRTPVLVLDSGSVDRTCAIATDLGAEVHERAFDNYSSQRNHALSLVRDRFEWVMFLDADEALTPALWREMQAAIATPGLEGAYIDMHLRWLGHDLVHGGPAHYTGLRLMRPDRVRFSGDVGERVDDAGLTTTRLRARIVHEDLKPAAEWFRKHIRYAERHAAHVFGESGRQLGLRGFGLRHKGQRMVGVRWVYRRLPLFVRPVLQFGRAVVVQGGWRDGIPGLLFAAMQALWYPMVIDLLIYEASRQQPGGEA